MLCLGSGRTCVAALRNITSNVAHQLSSVLHLVVIVSCFIVQAEHISDIIDLVFSVKVCDCATPGKMTDCGRCVRPIPKTGKNAPKVDCAECKLSFHGKCVDLTPDDIQYYVENNTVWRCEACAKERRKSMALESSMTSTITNEDVFNLVSELRKDLRGVEAGLGKSINTAFEELKETKGLVTSEPPPMVGQAGRLQGQDRSAFTYPSSGHARRCLIAVPATLRHWYHHK
ncbi:hypothetical protein J6590_092350 [Homalodisca vitripennis]|nr:hypothetical protein J6590_092350 [Homalodisca vitripennis]